MQGRSRRGHARAGRAPRAAGAPTVVSNLTLVRAQARRGGEVGASASRFAARSGTVPPGTRGGFASRCLRAAARRLAPPTPHCTHCPPRAHVPLKRGRAEAGAPHSRGIAGRRGLPATDLPQPGDRPRRPRCVDSYSINHRASAIESGAAAAAAAGQRPGRAPPAQLAARPGR